ncbi:hypothetical protein C8N25_13818 [Algoriphagus antarcticus]|uniref:Uncharacterized protein n=1 Tax=Algoriphagus antarcticus TaxID=238540 RepID=A0A3E0D6F7_9BACT|nr:hypothetical protein C8N25_13818 [Algoriphagus antarcticus]
MECCDLAKLGRNLLNQVRDKKTGNTISDKD